MLLSEPGPTQADLHFRIADIPVRVHPFFWVVPLLLSGGTLQVALIWVVAVFISILVHELGHAVVQRRYGGRPRIVLYGMGGLAIAEGVKDTPVRQILISLAGPFAGFLLAAILFFVIQMAGFQPRFYPWEMKVRYIEPQSYYVHAFLHGMFFINIFWGLVNLLPIYPLDGGQAARELLTMWLPPMKGVIVSLWVSIITAGAVAAYFFSTRIGTGLQGMFPVLMFGLLAVSSYQTLQAYQNSRRGGW